MNRRSFFRRATQVAGTAAIAPSLIKEALAIAPVDVPKTPLLVDKPEVVDVVWSMDGAYTSAYVCFHGCSAVSVMGEWDDYNPLSRERE